MRKLQSIQVLRGVAACAVVFHHAYSPADTHSMARIGAAGVDLFFVISGFIMATVGVGRKPGEFLADRIWRVFPLWLVAASPWLLIGSYSWQRIATTFTLWPIWSGEFHSPALAIGWTLCFEMLFYSAFAVALAARAIVPLAVFAVCLMLGEQNGLLSYIGSPLILEFLAGVCIARLKPSTNGPLFVAAGAIGFLVLPFDHYNTAFGIGAAWRALYWGVPAALMVYGARSLEHRFSNFALPLLLGNASYSIYLFHRLIVGRLPLPWMVAFAAGISLGLLAYWVIERRIIALKPWPRRPVTLASAP